MSNPKVGVHGLEKVGDWTVELSYSADEGDWAVTTVRKDSQAGNQVRGSETSMRNQFAGVVNGLTLAAGPPVTAREIQARFIVEGLDNLSESELREGLIRALDGEVVDAIGHNLLPLAAGGDDDLVVSVEILSETTAS